MSFNYVFFGIKYLEIQTFTLNFYVNLNFLKTKTYI